MESIARLLVPLSLAVVTTAVIGCLVIYNRKRRQQTHQTMADASQPTALEETRLSLMEKAQSTTTAEAEPAVAEETQPTPMEVAQAEVARETQPTVVQEAEPTATEEEKPVALEELQPTVVEETQPPVIERVQSTVLEEIKPAVAEEDQPRVIEKVSRSGEGGRREPGERGGRPRRPVQSGKKGSTPETKSRRHKPEIVCWKREREWILGVEVSEDILSNSGLAVLQNGLPLTQDDSRECCWHLKEACGEVVLRWNEEGIAREAKIEFGENGYLLFKLSGQNQGRQVKSPSSGSYLVMVPEDWERDEALSGPPPVTPENASLGYRAHFFELERGGSERIVFRTPNGESVAIESKTARFELIGNLLRDASESMGPLFGEKPPKIRALDDTGWRDVGTIVIGEEGSGKARWRKAFVPEQGLIEQVLPLEVADRKGGWYFLRFYDANDDLVESLDFRFISSLKEIRMPQLSPLPSEDGHRPVCVEFLHEPGCVVRQAGELANIQIEPQYDKTVLTIPPDLTCDKTCWLVGPEDGTQTEVTILVERLWWAIEEENREPSEWVDRPLALSREDFVATSRKALWLHLPRRRLVDKVLVGFEQSKARAYNVKVTEKTIAIPLRDFGDSEEVADRTQEHRLMIWIEHDAKPMGGAVAVLPASHQIVSLPTPYWGGVGRKKSALARAVLREGDGTIRVNGHPLEDYFGKAPLKAKQFLWRLRELPAVSQILSQMEVSIEVTGSSPTKTRQAKAVAHALARALMSYDPELRTLLKQAGFGGTRIRKGLAPTRRSNQ